MRPGGKQELGKQENTLIRNEDVKEICEIQKGREERDMKVELGKGEAGKRQQDIRQGKEGREVRIAGNIKCGNKKEECHAGIRKGKEKEHKQGKWRKGIS